MKNWCRLATLLVVALTTASAQVKTTGSPIGCAAGSKWDKSVNTNALGGSSTVDATLEACQGTCVKNTACVGIDWDTNREPHCWLTTSSTATLRTGQALGVDHYQLVVRGDPNACPTTCVFWDEFYAKSHVLGGTEFGNIGTTLEQCKAQCVTVGSSCVGIDYDSNVAVLVRCFLTSSSNANRYPADNVVHYVKSYRDCLQGSGCIMHVVDSSGKGGVFAVDPNDDYKVYISQDQSKAAVFVEFPCLIDPAGAMFNNCHSYAWRDQSDQFLRVGASSLYAVKFNQTGVDRFQDWYKQQVSFIRNDPPGGYFTLETAMLPGFYVGGVIGTAPTSDALVTKDISKLYCSSALVPGAVVKDQCPMVWNRIVGAKSSSISTEPYETDENGQHVTLETCRQRCIVNRNCIGVSLYVEVNVQVNNYGPYTYTYCKLRIATSSNSPRTVIQVDATSSTVASSTYYELFEMMPGAACPSADVCIYADPSRTSYCKKGANGFQVSNNMCDVNAALIGSSFTDDECRTVCINDMTCIGYELRNNTICYISRQPSQLQPSPASTVCNHFKINRSPSGNGCLHDWLFVPGTSVVNGTGVLQVSAANDRECRQSCISNSDCLGAAWHYVSTSNSYACLLVLSTNVQMIYGLFTPYDNYFKLNRNSNCS